MKKNHKIIALFLAGILFLAACPPVPALAEEGQEPAGFVAVPIDEASYAPVSQEEMVWEAAGDEAAANGIFSAQPERIPLEENGVLPSIYPAGITEMDLSSLKQIYPAVRDQGAYDCCWSFSANAITELSLLANDQAKRDELDFSELATAYSVFHAVKDPMGGLDGDSNVILSTAGNDFMTLGGNSWWALQTFFRWCGPNAEADIPYTAAESVRANGLSDQLVLNRRAQITAAKRIDIVNSPETVKAEIIRNGAVAGSYYDINRYYAQAGNAYYCDTYSYGTNHGITLIGWDDDFPAEKFNEVPEDSDGNPINGAWLARNSWGLNGAGHNGYFWISYGDASLNYSLTTSGVSTSTAFSAEYVLPGDAAWHDNNYQYDGSLGSAIFYDTNHSDLTLANIFTARKRENLSAVAIDLEEADVSYTIDIYTDLTDPENPESGTLAAAATSSGAFSLAGYYQIELAEPVELTEGTVFSVVVRLDSPHSAKISIDRSGTIYYSDTDTIQFTASFTTGQSFHKSGSRWYDLAEQTYGVGNLRIKAFTDDPEDASDQTAAWPFSDVKENSGGWAYEAIKFVWQKGIMTGDAMAVGKTTTTFRPNDAITRKELTKILWEMEGRPQPETGINPFSDINLKENGEKPYYYDPVLWASENGIVTGDKKAEGATKTTFRPNDPIKRQELATMLYRYAAFKGYDMTAGESLEDFPDQDKVANYAREALLWATNWGVISGNKIEENGITTYYLNPKNSTPRKECAKMIQNFFSILPAEE